MALTRWSSVRRLGIGVAAFAVAVLAAADTARHLAGDPIPLKSHKLRMMAGEDSPDEALRWRQIFERDENGVIAQNGLMNAHRYVEAMRARQAAAVAARAAAGETDELPGLAGISNGGWTWIGPGNIGGRTRAVAIHPTTTSTIFIGSVGGGIWKTTNSGGTWNIVNDFMTNLAISQILYLPSDPNVMFASTGEGFFNQDAIRGAGIFRSNDGGTTWSQLPSTANANFNFVNELAVSPDSTILLASTGAGLYRSGDLGASWQITTLNFNPGSGPFSVTNMMDVKFIPGSNTNAVASGRIRNAYHSSDGGVSWTLATGLVPITARHRVELGVSVTSPEVVYASVEEATSATFWKSTDFGASYAQASTPNHLGTQGWYDNAVWVDPTNANHVIIGGISMFRSIDGGATFGGWGGGGHSDQHAIISDPNFNGATNRRVYIGNDGGIYKWEDVSSTVTTTLNNNYGVTQFYGADGHVATGRVFGGTQDNGTKMFTPAFGPQGWTNLFGADGGFSTTDQVNNFLYGEIQNLGVHRSNNGALSQTITACGTPTQLTDGCTGGARNFIAPILLDPNNPDRLLAGGGNLWLSTNPRSNPANTVAWSIIKPSIGSNISAIAVTKGNSDLIWIGHNNGNVYMTADGTAPSPTWIQRDGVTLPGRAVSSIAVDPLDSNTVYASFGGFETYFSGNLWVTHDSGATWTNASGTGGGALPPAPVRSVVPHPSVSGWVYAATDVGIFASEDGGNSWQVPHDGPANVATFQLFFMNTTLVAVTHGRGLYTIDITPPTTPPAIGTHPASQTLAVGQTALLSVSASGGSPLGYQWYRGTSPSTANPIGGATSPSFTTPPLSITTSYWVRVTNGFGSADSNTAVMTIDPDLAQYDGTLKAPKCAIVGSVCDSGPAVLNGRANIASGLEPNQPNTINNSCSDGTLGVYHNDESVDRVKASTLDGSPFGPGKALKIDVTVWADAGAFASDRLDLYGAADATNPVWTFITTIAPAAGGAQILSDSSYVLPGGTLQAVRASFRFGGAASPCGANSGFDDHDDLIFAVNPAFGTDLVQNGSFGAGLGSWFLHEVPDIVHNSASNGRFEYHKANPTSTGSGQAVIFQNTGVSVANGTDLSAQFDIGNTDSMRKRISVLIIDADFSDLSVCTFWLAPSVPLATYQMRTHPTKNWANASIYFYAASGNATGDYLLDNVSVRVGATTSGTRTDCVDPARPTPPGGAAGPNLLGNGDFSSPTLPPWGPFFDITHQVTGGVFEFIRPGTPGVPAGGIIQATGQAMTSGQIMTATFQLGNSSSVRKRVTVLLHEHDFSDLSACTFWIPPGAALSNFAMRTYATKAWTDTRFSVYAASTGPDQWTRLDNVTLSRTPGPSQFLGTECFEPGSAPAPPIDELQAMGSMPSGWTADTWRPGLQTRLIDSDVGTTGWRAEATESGRAILVRPDPIDLTGAIEATLYFDSWLSGGSPAAVEVSLDAMTWETVANVSPSTGWVTTGVDLDAYAGHRIYVRFVFDAVAQAVGVAPDVWRIQNVSIVSQLLYERTP